MKEATGELNITVITIVAIGALAAFFYFVIWPGIQTSMALTSACNAGPETKSGDTSTASGGVTCTKDNGDGQFTCTYSNSRGQTQTKTCNSSK